MNKMKERITKISLGLQLAFLTALISFPGNADAKYQNRNFLRSDVAFEAAVLDPTKKTVCTITINSDNERKLFWKYLNPKDFQFIELTPEKTATKIDEKTGDKFGDDPWFDQACKTEIKCDILVISGHFGGKFVGDRGFSLDLGTIESHACARDCAGITSNPTETFLFGCNTLAGKKKDSRTVEEYFQVLVKEGWNPTDAQAVAEARYGALAQDNRERMRMAFRGVKNIYGFDSIAPSGKTVDPLLENYLRSVGNYREHLDQMSRMEISSDDQILNPLLGRALKPTALTQCTSSKDSPTNCGLFDPAFSRLERTKFAESLLNRSDRLKYLSAVLNFVEQAYVYYEAQPNVEEQAVIDRMKANTAAKQDIAHARTLISAPSAAITLIRLQSWFNWLSDEELGVAHAKVASDLFKLPVSILSKDTLCGIYGHQGAIGDHSYLTDNDNFKITRAHLKDLNALEAIHCMELGDDEQFTKFAIEAISGKTLSDRALYFIVDSVTDLDPGTRQDSPAVRFEKFDSIIGNLRRQGSVNRSKKTREALDTAIGQLQHKRKELEDFWKKNPPKKK